MFISLHLDYQQTHYEAMDVALWSTIGKEFLIKSNINNWIACKEGTGSLVQQKAGSVTCKLVKQVSKQCAGGCQSRCHCQTPTDRFSSASAAIITLMVIRLVIGLSMIHVEEAKQIS